MEKTCQAAESIISKAGSAGPREKDENEPPFYLLIVLGVILVLMLVIFSAIVLNAKKVRGQEKGKTVTRISGDQHPFDDKVEKEQ